MPNDPTRYIPVEIDRRTGVHRLLLPSSAPHNECIAAFQGQGPNPCESPFVRVSFIAHVGDGESWWRKTP